MLALGVRGLQLAAVAPLITVGMLGSGAVVADWVSVPWTPVTACVLTAGSAAVGHLIGRATKPAPTHTMPPASRWVPGAIAIGVLAQVIPLFAGIRRPGRLLDAFDAVFHITVVQYIQESGTASSLTIVGQSAPSVGSGFYAVGWHAVTALAPDWPDPAVVFTMAAFLPTAAAWTTGIALLTRAAFPESHRAVPWAALFSAAGISLPLVLAQQKAGLIPNSLGVALLPGFLGLVIGREDRPRSHRCLLVGGALAGLGLAHPNAVLSALLAVGIWALLRFWPRIRRAASAPRLAVGGALAAVLVAGAATAAATGLGRSVVDFPGDQPSPAIDTFAAVVTGQMGSSASGGGLFVMLLGFMGAWRALRRPATRPLAGALVGFLALFVLARSSIPVLTDLDALWYHEPKRIAPVVIALLLPLAAVAIDGIGVSLATSRVVRTTLPAPRISLLVGTLVAFTGISLGAVETAGQARASYAAGTGGEPTFATDAELAMMHRLHSVLDPHRAVLGHPHSGAAHLYALIGQPVTVRTSTEYRSPELVYITEHLDELGSSDELCSALDALEIGYLYVDPVRFRPEGFPYPPLTEPPRSGVRLIDRGGTAQLYEITGCA